jgi:hypothetical protein
MDDGGGDHDLLLDEARIRVQADFHPPPLQAAGRHAIGVAGSVGRARVRGLGMGRGDAESQDQAYGEGVDHRLALHSYVLPSGL